MIQRPTRKMHRDEEAISLNITPVMNLFVVLIPFLLTSAAFMQLAVVDTSLPRLAEVQQVEEDQKDKLVVTVTIKESGLEIGRVGQDRSATRQKRWNRAGDLSGVVRRNKSGEYNYAALTQQMVRIKDSYPDSLSVLILPEENVTYNTIVQVMDATREMRIAGEELGKRRLLFPDAVIGHLAEPGKSGK